MTDKTSQLEPDVEVIHRQPAKKKYEELPADAYEREPPEKTEAMIREEQATIECRHHCKEGCTSVCCCFPHCYICPCLCALAVCENGGHGGFDPKYHGTKREWWAITCCMAPCALAEQFVCCSSPRLIWEWFKKH